jgi:hypothetical protein
MHRLALSHLSFHSTAADRCYFPPAGEQSRDAILYEAYSNIFSSSRERVTRVRGRFASYTYAQMSSSLFLVDLSALQLGGISNARGHKFSYEILAAKAEAGNRKPRS